MGRIVLKKELVDKDVWTLTLERIEDAYKRFDTVSVGFSGGKDSTVVLNCAIHVAKALGKLPVQAYFLDEEVIHKETIDYVQRVTDSKEVEVSWFAIPIRYRNACSREFPYWYAWGEESRDLWTRDMPAHAITEHDLARFKRGPISNVCNVIFDPAKHGTVGVLQGLRADESIRRYMAVAKRERDNWIAPDRNAKGVYICKPIFDWSTKDVWTAPAKFGWDFNRAYDVMRMMGIKRGDQRVSPPYGEASMLAMWMYAEGWPDLYEKMILRVPGAATASRHGRTPLYGSNAVQKPEGMTWEQAIREAVERWPVNQRKVVADGIRREIRRHNRQTDNSPIPDKADGGLSWQWLYMCAVAGNMKRRRMVLHNPWAQRAAQAKDREAVRQAEKEEAADDEAEANEEG